MQLLIALFVFVSVIASQEIRRDRLFERNPQDDQSPDSVEKTGISRICSKKEFERLFSGNVSSIMSKARDLFVCILLYEFTFGK